MSFSAQSSFGRGSMFLLLILLHAASASSCDQALQHDVVCTMDYNNLLSSTTTIPTVTDCQEKCLSTDGCNHFTFLRTSPTNSSSPVCSLLRSCETKTACSSSQNCVNSVSGAKTPSIRDACCSGLTGKICKGKFDRILSQHFQISSPDQCQALCQAHPECRYFTQISGDICFLYNTCNQTESCSSCTSGPANPSWYECNSEVDFQTLLLGGWTQDRDDTGPTEFSSSLELVTEDNACRPSIPEMPEGRKNFAATLLGKTLLYCGGATTSTNCGHHGDCYTFQLDKTVAAWEQSAFMNIPRYHFSMVAVQGKAYAIGGKGALGDYTGRTVEEYTPGEGWRVREDMSLPYYVSSHCSVSIGRRIIVVGGYVDSSYYSSNVYEFDLDAPEKSWTRLDRTNYGRQHHSCTVGSYQGQQGIFVTGGVSTANNRVEFLIDSVKKWRVLPAMSRQRQFHTSSFMGGTIFSFGGHDPKKRQTEINQGRQETGEATFEMLNTTGLLSGSFQWTTMNLQSERKYHAGISLPAGTLTCLEGDNLG